MHLDSPTSWISTYAPLFTACAALIAALVALGGVWWNNKHAASRQKADIAAAEKRAAGDRDAAATRERERHRREEMTTKVGDLVATILEIPRHIQHTARAVARTYQEPGGAGPTPAELRQDIAERRNTMRDLETRAQSLNCQIQLLSPPSRLEKSLTTLVEDARDAILGCLRRNGPDGHIERSDAAARKLTSDARAVVGTYRDETEWE